MNSLGNNGNESRLVSEGKQYAIRYPIVSYFLNYLEEQKVVRTMPSSRKQECLKGAEYSQHCYMILM